MNPPRWLVALGIPKTCIAHRSSARERGRRFSIRPQRGHKRDEIWRVHVDGCWLDQSVQKVDYLFCGQSASGRRVILLVELKGQNYNKALDQIESTLQYLCKRSASNRVHARAHQGHPGHDLPVADSVRAYVVLSKGKGVPLRAMRRERLRKKYGVIVDHRETKFEVDGLDTLLNR